MKTTAAECIQIIKREQAALYNEIMELSTIIAHESTPMSNKEFQDLQGYYDSQHIAHNQYLILQKVLNIIEATEEEKR